jgi:hypothetical protein
MSAARPFRRRSLPLGGERGREQSGGLFVPASARSAKGAA